jgi:hypothetical protein
LSPSAIAEAHRICARRAVERREDAVAGHVDLVPAKASELRAHEAMVLGEQVFPAAVAEFRRLLRGSDDVSEQKCREHAVRLHLLSNTRQKTLDLVEERDLISLPGRWSFPATRPRVRPGCARP